MNRIGNVDYHVHYFIDKCAQEEMTLSNIEKTAFQLGLKEICVLKHYCDHLPNGKDEFITWYRIKPNEFDYFVNDITTYQSKYDIRILSGVETELLDDKGTINIPKDKVDLIDFIALSCHWLLNMEVLPMDLFYYPNASFYENEGERKEAQEAINHWIAKVKKTDTATIIKSYVNAYVKAIEGNNKIKTLSHMYDGLFPLDLYHIPVDELSKTDLIDVMTPLFEICAEKKVLWELLSTPVKRPFILQAAKEHGVKFCASSDSHMIANGWGNLVDHYQSEAYIDSLELPKGIIK
ncbi:hypothetical protein RBG61_08845 [Paludicola sp. MB14-C6]|uniref:hypothetical protein n=1 Tax=Paludihabitans sp. MB14-C6 TaxID=3070656 RepID=UPI0027DE7A4D|nr:hypothetical protein [Paludicola sp. MB14-C6]WMJ22107.1 hypothetical protein RBG61_08845 [Paludicola sp. MB14-C6]